MKKKTLRGVKKCDAHIKLQEGCDQPRWQRARRQFASSQGAAGLGAMTTITQHILAFVAVNKGLVCGYGALLAVMTALSVVGLTKTTSALYQSATEKDYCRAMKAFVAVAVVSIAILACYFGVEYLENTLDVAFNEFVMVRVIGSVFEANDSHVLDIGPMQYRAFVRTSADASREVFKQLLKTYAPGAVLVVVMVLFMFVLDWRYGTIFLAGGAVAGCLVALNYGQLVEGCRLSEKLWRTADFTTFDILQAIPTVVAAGTSALEQDSIAAVMGEAARVRLHVTQQMSLFNALFNSILLATVLAVMFTAVKKLGVASTDVSKVVTTLSLMATIQARVQHMNVSNERMMEQTGRFRASVLEAVDFASLARGSLLVCDGAPCGTGVGAGVGAVSDIANKLAGDDTGTDIKAAAGAHGVQGADSAVHDTAVDTTTPGHCATRNKADTKSVDGAESGTKSADDAKSGTKSGTKSADAAKSGTKSGTKSGITDFSARGCSFKVEFDHVTFAYPGDNRDVLRDFSWQFGPGGISCLRARSGAGKTTLAKLLMGMHEPREGAIRVNGRHVSDVARADLRRHVTFTNQDQPILNRTIGEVIRYGTRVTDERVEGVWARIRGAFEGKTLQTRVGKLGKNCSTGMRQLLRLANIELRGSSCVVADEPCSGLDADNKRRVTDSLKALAAAGATVLIITHDDETASLADNVRHME